ncbi:MAG: VCBS repeat-containing protein, partial [Bacteroidota bacterium]
MAARRTLVIICFVVCAVCSAASAGELDTLWGYNPHSKYIYYSGPNISLQAARFEPLAPGYVESVTIVLGGAADHGSATVHIFGHEGGISAPVLSTDLLPPITITKTRPGIQQILVKLPKPVFISGTQFFIGVNDLSAGLVLLSDRSVKRMSCRSELDTFSYQFIRYADGSWKWGRYGYAISAIIRYPKAASPAYLTNIARQSHGLDSSLCNGSISWCDLDHDGYLDLLVGGKVFHNDHGGQFIDITAQSGVSGRPRANAFIDMDGDGNMDLLFIGSLDSGSRRSVLFHNTGNGAFERRSIDLPDIINPTSFSIADINQDGRPDIFIGQDRKDTETVAPLNYLLLNDGGKNFTDASNLLYGDAHASTGSRGSRWVDVNNDGHLDLFVAGSANGIELWRNNGNGTFTDIAGSLLPSLSSPERGRFSGGDWADYSGTGRQGLLLPRSLGAGALIDGVQGRTSMFIA